MTRVALPPPAVSSLRADVVTDAAADGDASAAAAAAATAAPTREVRYTRASASALGLRGRRRVRAACPSTIGGGCAAGASKRCTKRALSGDEAKTPVLADRPSPMELPLPAMYSCAARTADARWCLFSA